ncbi:Hsp20/alpha crystallin family protein [Sphingobacteriales bacterium UPWRP_1]|nr:hypothetical protein BVG80_05735 [Sphingobacteriales bacterium TSM_CSM]PSJ78001.1 Hsp20/alpha crystallin family protein [Sphingobacteriales bacterium UPWRP_1]
MHYGKSACYSNSWQQHGCKGTRFMHGGFWGRSFWAAPPVNIEEKPASFEVLLYAPGFTKEDFIIEISGNEMSISLKEETSGSATANWVRREYRNTGFVRRFELGDKIDTANISAKYENGVLQITLPKKNADTPAQNIVVE